MMVINILPPPPPWGYSYKDPSREALGKRKGDSGFRYVKG